MPNATQQTFPKLAFDGGVTFEDSNETPDSYRCDHVSSREFDKIVEGFDDLGIDQIASYKEMERPGLTSRFVSYRNGEAIGAAVVVNYALPVIGRGVANVRFGPIWRRKGKPIEFRNYRTIVRQLIQEYAGNRGHMLTILPKPHPKFAHDECELLESMGFHSRTAAATSSRFMVNLDLAPDCQLASLTQKWRYNLRKAHKNNLVITRDDGSDAHDKFVTIHGRMISRKSITLADDTDIIPKLREVLPHGLSPRTYLAWNGDELVAGAIVMTMGDTAHYLYGATAGPGLKLRASYALHWHIVEQLARENFKYYDLGGSSGFEGLRQFKSGLSGSEGFEVDIPDEYDYGTNLSANMCGNAVHQLRSIKGMHIHAMNKFRLGGNVA